MKYSQHRQCITLSFTVVSICLCLYFASVGDPVAWAENIAHGKTGNVFSSQKPEIVEDVIIKGNQRIEDDAILTVVRTMKGDVLDYEKLDRDLRDIYRMNYFSNVSIDIKDGKKGKIVTFIVKEKPIIEQIKFEGNHAIKDEKLKEELGIDLYSVFDRNEVKQSVIRLINLYKKKGYYNAEVHAKTEALPHNSVRIKYIINEHEKVYIVNIRIRGNRAFSNSDIKGIMLTKEKNILSWLTDSGCLDDKKLEYDVHKIAIFYNNHGYIKAKVGEPEIYYDKTKNGLVVTIHIKEGVQYKINSVNVAGDIIKDRDEILKILELEKGQVFNRKLVRDDIDNIKKMYSDAGYAYVEVIPDTHQDDKKLLIDITYKIVKGPKVIIERINITGNTKTRDKVIRRELELAEGDYFDGKKLSLSKENLDRLGFFKKTKIERKKGNAKNTMVIDVNVQEARTGSLSVGAGFSSIDSLVAMAQISEKNFRGLGESLSANLRIGTITNQFDVSFHEPWILDHPVSGTVRLYRWGREYDDWDQDSTGGELSSGFPVKSIDQYTYAWISYRYDDSDISNVDSDAAWDIREMKGEWVTSSIGGGIKRSSVNRAENPSKGSINSISIEWAGGFLGGDNEFTKITAKTQWFFGVTKKTVIMVQGRWGYIQKRGGKLPVYERFFLGGIDTIRGFKYRNISPRDPKTGDRIGGDKMMVYNLEYRFPISDNQGLMGLIFFDAGNVYGSGEHFSLSGIRRSVGLGVRWKSPMGPILVEWGYNLDKKEDEKGSKLDFSMGGSW